MQKRGILYLHWGNNETTLQRSIASAAAHHPELPVHVERLPETATLLDKATMFDRSPFEETLFLDHDTVVLGPLNFGFVMARRHGLACCICEHPWARRYGGLTSTGDLVEFNTGVLFFTRGQLNSRRDVFHLWMQHSRTLDSSIQFHGPGPERKLCRMPLNDQAGFALAVASGRPPSVLPLNWNFRPSWHRSFWGPIKIWHDYREPPADLVTFSQEQSRPGAILEYRELAL